MIIIIFHLFKHTSKDHPHFCQNKSKMQVLRAFLQLVEKQHNDLNYDATLQQSKERGTKYLIWLFDYSF